MEQSLPPPADAASSGIKQSGGTNELLRQRRLWGWVFLSPWIIGFLAFTIIPMIASLAFSFMEFNLARPDEATFIGFSNYQNLLKI